jgi:hypothetical protein
VLVKKDFGFVKKGQKRCQNLPKVTHTKNRKKKREFSSIRRDFS